MTNQINADEHRDVQWLRTVVKTIALFGADLNAAQSEAHLAALLAAGMTDEDVRTLRNQAYRSPRRADLVPVTLVLLGRLREVARKKAGYGSEVDAESTMERLEATIAAGMTRHDALVLLRQFLGSRAHRTAKQPLALSAISGIESLVVAEGCYAVFVDGIMRFYRVYTPEVGEVVGEPVLRRYASGNLLGLYPDEGITVMHLIAADPDGAAYRFSDEFTLCHLCARNLTDNVSRMISVGPTCRGFNAHRGLKEAAAAIDLAPSRKSLFRALRAWSTEKGFRDPKSKQERDSWDARMFTAARVAAAWSGLPGILNYDDDQALAMIDAALAGDVVEPLTEMLLAAPDDTLLDLAHSGVLSVPLLNLLVDHRSKKVRDAAGLHVVALLAGAM